MASVDGAGSPAARAAAGGGAGGARAREVAALAGAPAQARRGRAGRHAAVPAHARGRARGPRDALARGGAQAMSSIERLIARKEVVICAGSGGVGKTTTSAAIAAGMAERGKTAAVLTIDPAKRLANSLGPEGAGQRGGAGGAGRARRAVGDDARRQAHLRRAGGHPRPDEKTRDAVLTNPDLPAVVQRGGRLPGVHGDGEAPRAPSGGQLRPAGARHAAHPQRARLPRRPPPPGPLHRLALAQLLPRLEQARLRDPRAAARGCSSR